MMFGRRQWVEEFGQPTYQVHGGDCLAYRKGWPSSVDHPFMDFVGYEELTIGFFVGMHMVTDVFYVNFDEVFTIVNEPRLDVVYHCHGVGMCVLLGEV